MRCINRERCASYIGSYAWRILRVKNGGSRLRKSLYMPTLAAWQYNPAIRTYCERLKANGKNGKPIACAAMRNQIHLTFAILKSSKPFDPFFTCMIEFKSISMGLLARRDVS